KCAHMECKFNAIYAEAARARVLTASARSQQEIACQVAVQNERPPLTVREYFRGKCSLTEAKLHPARIHRMAQFDLSEFWCGVWPAPGRRPPWRQAPPSCRPIPALVACSGLWLSGLVDRPGQLLAGLVRLVPGRVGPHGCARRGADGLGSHRVP